MVNEDSGPTTLGPYQLGALIARGGMGEVFKAFDPRLGRSVAIKRVRGDGAVEEARQRLRREARAAAILSHPSIVQVYDILQHESDDWIVMEWVDGPSLRKKIAGGPLDPLQVACLGLHVAEGLAAAHAYGILHRDLKTENVLLAPDGRAKILDFGLAKQVHGGEGTQLTESGRLLGTCRAMSPEQARGFVLDERSDLFSLGVLLYELGTGVSPFRASNITETLLKVCSYAPESVQELNPEMPHELSELVDNLLEKPPARRPDSAELVARQLQRLVRRLEPGGTLGEVASGPTISRLSSQAEGVEAAQRRQGAFGHDQEILAGQTTLFEDAQDSGSGTYGDGTRLLQASSGRRRLAAALLVGLGLLAFGIPEVTDPVVDWISGWSGGATSSTFQPLLDRTVPAPSVPDEEATPRLVVLPFDSLGPEDDHYIAAGISEEIMQRLASLSGLGVVSRTSARRAIQDGWTVQEIGRRLEVGYLLEGMINSPPPARAEEAIRVALRLVRVEDDTLIWTQHFERQPEDLLQLQSEIAAGVVERLDIALKQPEEEALALALTTEPEAYFAYLRGLEYMHTSEYSEEAMLRAAGMFQKAVEVDPQFVEALSGLSRMHSHIHFNFDDSEERRQEALRALEAAEVLAPERWAVRMARAFYAYRVENRYEEALTAFGQAAQLTPNHGEVLRGIGYVRRRQGRLSEAVNVFTQAFNLDQGNASLADDIAYTYRDMRRYEAAEAWFVKTLALAPDLPGTTAQRALNYLDLYDCPDPTDPTAPCSTEGARSILAESPNRDHRATYGAYLYLDLMDANRADAGKAKNILTQALERMASQRSTHQQYMRLGVFWHEVQLLEMAGRSDVALSEVLELRQELEPQMDQEGGQGLTLPAHLKAAHLGLVYAYLGFYKEALSYGEKAVDLTQHDAYSGPVMRKYLALIYLRSGLQNQAVDELESLLRSDWKNPLTETEVALDPLWKDVWESRRFQNVLRNLETLSRSSRR